MQGKEVNANADILGLDSAQESQAIDFQGLRSNQEGIQMSCVPALVVRWWGQHLRQLLKGSIVASPDLLSPQEILLHPRQLVDTEGRLKVHHVALVAGAQNIVGLESLG